MTAAQAIPCLMFDGLVDVFSTCRDCGYILRVTNCGDTVHPNCVPKPTKLESLAVGWLSTVLADDDEASYLTEKEILELDAQPPDLGAAAIGYASMGWPVFPLAPHGKHPVIPSAHPKGDPLRGKCKGECGKPGHGLYDATNDVDRIRRWWSRHPRHNIGLATGHLFDVIDIDPAKGGVLSLVNLLALQHIPTCHGVVCTASSGLHMYVKPTGKGNFAGLYPGIDYRGVGGLVVAPPSSRGVTCWSWSTTPSPTIKGDNA